MDFDVKTKGSAPPAQFIEFQVQYCAPVTDAIDLADTAGGVTATTDKSWVTVVEIPPTRAGFMKFSVSVDRAKLAMGSQSAIATITIPAVNSCDGAASVKTFPINAMLSKVGKKFI